MGRFRHIVWLMLMSSVLQAQPGMLGTQLVNGSYQSYSLNDMGIFRQMRLQASSSAGTGARNWEFYEAPADYDPAWRPYFSGYTLSGYDQPIPPAALTASANMNTGFGGSSGLLPAVTSGKYYTFNVTERSVPGTPVNEHMGVLETSYDPVAITSVVQSPGGGAVYPENSVYVTITLASSLSADEYAYVRYSTTFNFTSSTLLPVTITGTTGTVEIPCQTAGTTIYYYAYTSNRTSAEILADVGVVAIGENAHDMSTLRINNNGGPNYSYTVLPSIGYCGSYYVPSTCYPTINSFVTALNAGTVSCAVTCYVAAGHTETAPAGGITLTQTGTATNTITFVKNGAGANPIIYAPVGTNSITAASTVADGVFSLNGSDYITIDGIDIMDNNTTGAAMMEYGYGLFKPSNIDGCQNNTIRNCTITLKNSNYWTGAPLNFELGSVGILMRNTARTSLTTLHTISSAAGRSDNNQFYGNTITNVINGFVISGYNDVFWPYNYYDQNNSIGIGGLGNTVTNYGNPATTSRASGVYVIYNNNVTISNNDFISYSGGTYHGSTIYGAFVSSPISGTFGQNITITNNHISLSTSGSSRITGIRTGNSGVGAGVITITGNTIEDSYYASGATGDFYAIDQQFNGSTVTISDNIIQNNTLNTATTNISYLIYNNVNSPDIYVENNQMLNNAKTVVATGSLYGYYTGSSTATGQQTFNNNTIDGLSVMSASAAYVIGARFSSALAQIKTITNNTISNITSGTGFTVWASGLTVENMGAGSIIDGNYISEMTSGSVCVGINAIGTASASLSTNVNYSVTNNHVNGIHANGTAAGYGINCGLSTSTGTSLVCSNNIAENVYAGGATNSIYGLYIYGGKTGSLHDVHHNIVRYMYASATNNTTGIMHSANLADTKLYNCLVHDLHAVSGVATGINVFTNETCDLYNNIVTKLTANASTSSFGVVGISLASGSATYTARYNTISLGRDAQFTSSATNFGFAGIYIAGASAIVTMNNNIVYVNGIPKGTGIGCAFNSPVGTVGLNPSFFTGTDNNYYYIPNNTWNYIYVQGSTNAVCINGYAYGGAFTSAARNLNNDECFNDGGTGLYKNYMSPNDGNSYFDIPPFAGGAISPDDVKLTPGAITYAESNAQVIAGITTDYEGDIRSASTPDIGADEGDFLPQTIDCYLLPIELLTFTGWADDVFNELFWVTLTEQNTAHFLVERSLDGFNFNPIGSINAHGNSEIAVDYSFIDHDPVPGMNYYRLRSVDLDDSYTFSNVIAIDRNGTRSGVPSVFPNPTSGSITVSYVISSEDPVQLEVVNMLGQVVISKILDATSNSNTIQLDMSDLPKATYTLRIYGAGSSTIQSTVFVKN